MSARWRDAHVRGGDQSEEGREDIPGAGTNRRRDGRIYPGRGPIGVVCRMNTAKTTGAHHARACSRTFRSRVSVTSSFACPVSATNLRNVDVVEDAVGGDFVLAGASPEASHGV
eukprot:7399431-Pyramimonas_sp.AAC.3